MLLQEGDRSEREVLDKPDPELAASAAMLLAASRQKQIASSSRREWGTPKSIKFGNAQILIYLIKNSVGVVEFIFLVGFVKPL